MPKGNNKIDWEEIIGKFYSYKGSINESCKENKDELRLKELTPMLEEFIDYVEIDNNGTERSISRLL